MRTPTTAAAEPVAGWILRQIEAGAGAPLTAAIVGPGGTGKSTLLNAIATAYDAAGAPAVRVGPDTDVGALADGIPVLVDDAHRLAPDTLATLRERARRDDARMVVGYRPWPRPDGLSALGALVSRRHSPIVLGHLGRDEVAAHVARRVGGPPPDALVALVHEQSGGLLMFVGLVTQAMLDTGRFDPRHPDRFRRPQRVSVSPGLAERLRYLLEALDPPIYRLLEAMALGAPLDAEVLGGLLGTDQDALADTVEAAMATGLVTDSGDLVVFVRNLLLRLVPVLRRRSMQHRLADIQVANGGPVLAAGRQLAESHATGARAFTVLAAAADEALHTSPHLAVELYDAAVRAGGDARSVLARRAQASALAGDPVQALRLADQILSEDGSGPDRWRAVTVSAAILARRGFAARAGELYQSLAGPGSADALLAVPALLACGDLARARDVAAAAPPSESDAPTLTASVVRLLANGMLESVDGSATVGLSLLVRAAGLLDTAGDAVPLPYSPTELVASVAGQCGETALAEATLSRAIAAKLGGGFTHARHVLQHGWHALRRGGTDTARGALDRVGGMTLEPGDELLAATLAVGLARQSGDAAALGTAFARARTALLRHPVDLYLMRQVGELAVAAAILGERASVAVHVEQARALLVRLGDPPLWTAALRWGELHAELAAGDLDAAARVVSELPGEPFASAGACWLRVTRGEPIDPDGIRAAATGLHQAGLTWDGAQLAAAAALHTTDRKAAAALLAFARGLSDVSVPEQAVPPADVAESTEPAADPAAAAQLSDREVEVGRLILAGLTHKQIGARLFISAKTVEHHVARMRNRLGADGRNELFGILRHVIDTADQTTETTDDARPAPVRTPAR
jgi:DNA-binding CsgD family transcriptional regulator